MPDKRTSNHSAPDATHATVRGYDDAGRITFTAHFEADERTDRVWLHLVGKRPGAYQDTHRPWITRRFFKRPGDAGKFHREHNILVSVEHPHRLVVPNISTTVESLLLTLYHPFDDRLYLLLYFNTFLACYKLYLYMILLQTRLFDLDSLEQLWSPGGQS